MHAPAAAQTVILPAPPVPGSTRASPETQERGGYVIKSFSFDRGPDRRRGSGRVAGLRCNSRARNACQGRGPTRQGPAYTDSRCEACRQDGNAERSASRSFGSGQDAPGRSQAYAQTRQGQARHADSGERARRSGKGPRHAQISSALSRPAGTACVAATRALCGRARTGARRRCLLRAEDHRTPAPQPDHRAGRDVAREP